MTTDALRKLDEGSARLLAEWDAADAPAEVEKSPATPGRLKDALETGGRAILSVRSKKTGAHVSIRLAAKKKKPGGQGWVSRGSIEGRVGAKEADAIFADDPTLDWPETRIGSFDLSTGEWKAAKDADAARVWAAEKAIFWALGSYPLDEKAEVFIELSCAFCGHALRDPVSVERGIGPECYGRHTGSKSAGRS